jgi:hypothetical protein
MQNRNNPLPHNIPRKPLSPEAKAYLSTHYHGWEHLGLMETSKPGDLWWDRRIYIPIHHPLTGELVAAQTRHYDGDRIYNVLGPDHGLSGFTRKVPKYLSSDLGGNDGIVGVEVDPGHCALWILVEGMFDLGGTTAAIEAAWDYGGFECDLQPAATLGTAICPAQISTLVSLGMQRAIVLYDPDRLSEADKAQRLLSEWGIPSVIASEELGKCDVVLGDGDPDPANVGPKQLTEVIRGAAAKL